MRNFSQLWFGQFLRNRGKDEKKIYFIPSKLGFRKITWSLSKQKLNFLPDGFLKGSKKISGAHDYSFRFCSVNKLLMFKWLLWVLCAPCSVRWWYWRSLLLYLGASPAFHLSVNKKWTLVVNLNFFIPKSCCTYATRR